MATPSVSTKPWGDIKESDYSIEQWHRACLIHQHTGMPTSKDQCKLPVRTPEGTLNRNGVHAAAAALAGARGGLLATADQKAAAHTALMRLYAKLNEEMPASLMQNMSHDAIERVGNFIEHFGRKGMKWGQRIFSRGSDSGTSGTSESAKSSSSSGEAHTLSDAERASMTAEKIRKEGLSSVSNAEMQHLISRMNLQAQMTALTTKPTKIARGREFVNRQLKTGKTINDAIAFANSPAGKLLASTLAPTSGRHAAGSRASNRKLTPKVP